MCRAYNDSYSIIMYSISSFFWAYWCNIVFFLWFKKWWCSHIRINLLNKTSHKTYHWPIIVNFASIIKIKTCFYKVHTHNIKLHVIEHQIAPTNYMGSTKTQNFDILEPTSNGQTVHIIAVWYIMELAHLMPNTNIHVSNNVLAKMKTMVETIVLHNHHERGWWQLPRLINKIKFNWMCKDNKMELNFHCTL
jgi:hypothetical protein